MKEKLGVSERRACRVLGHPAIHQRFETKPTGDGKALREEVVRLATLYGRYGYRRVTALLRLSGWEVNTKRVERIWRQEG